MRYHLFCIFIGLNDHVCAVVFIILVDPVRVKVPVQESLDQTASHSQPDKVTDRDIPDLVSQIRVQNKSWSKLAVRLKVPMKKISEIRSSRLTHDQACEKIFQTWLAEPKNPLTRPELEDLITRL